MRVTNISAILTIFASLLVSGCMSPGPQTSLYILDAPSTQEKATITDSKSYAVTIVPIKIPAYLDRLDVTTLSCPGKLAYSDLHQWASPLSDTIRLALARNLSRELKSDQITLKSQHAKGKNAFSVKVEIVDFNGTLGDNAYLNARWTLSSSKDTTLIEKSFQKSTELSDIDVLSYVNAQSSLVSELASDIAKSIQEQGAN